MIADRRTALLVGAAVAATGSLHGGSAARQPAARNSVSPRIHFAARPAHRAALTATLLDVLGARHSATIESAPGAPIAAFDFPGGGSVSVEFSDGALDPSEARRGAWFEVRCADPAATISAVRRAGLEQVRHPATSTFYFALPGGQIVGLV